MEKLEISMKKTVLATIVAGAALFAADVTAQTCKGPQPSICTRSCWGARASSTTYLSALTRAIVHHTAGAGEYTTSYETGKSKVRGIQNYHMDVQGWSDIGYHFLFNAAGHVYEGRIGSMASLPRGAHDGCNADSFGFTAMGYYHPPYNQAFTSATKNAMEATIAWRMPTGWSASQTSTYCGVTAYRVDGHYKVKATACPGDVIIPQLGSVRTGVNSKRSCGSTSKTARDVDNSSGGFSVVGSWATGTGAGKYGVDYRYKSTAPVSEPATWATSLNTTATWNVRAWWVAGANRSASAPYIVSHGGGTTTVNVNQQTGGGAWHLLGSWSMGGAQDVQLSCWAATGFVVIADAIRWD
jgi:hypothetical protein